MKFITQTDIKNWEEKDCQALLPELVRRLIHASGQEFEHLTMPSGDGVALPDWDGIVECTERIFTIDAGLSLWEMGSDKNVLKKAESDYNKRTKNSGGYKPQDATFVFVTSKIWTKANMWVQEKRTEGKWKNVVVYTAVELEDWIKQCPAVGIWLANHLGKLKNKNLETPEMFWERWSKGKDYSIFPSCILGGRADIIEKVCNCIRFPQVLCVQAHSRKEAMAFIVASLLKDGAEKSVIVSNIEDTHYLVNNYKNTIIVTYAIDSWEFATKNGNSVIIAASQEEQIRDAVKLPSIERNAFIQSLEESGIEHEKAIRLATMTGRNIMTLRRELGIDNQKPIWATAEKMNIYLPAVLLGRWNGKIEGDRELIETMSGCNYLDYENELQKELIKDDCPFVRVGDDWQILSASEVYNYCTSFISDLFLERFGEVVEKIISDADPEINKRIDDGNFFIPQSYPRYSGRIKYGVFLTLIFFSLDEEDKITFSQDVLRKNLHRATTEQILSLEHYFPLIAEAAPEVFIELIEKDFGNGSKIINQLFKYNPDCFTFGPIGHYHNLLFSLEALAWDTSRMTQIADILIRLLSYPVPSNNAQKPFESLKNIFRYVLPQTFVPCKNRLKIHSRLCKKYSNYAYILSMLVVKSLTDNIYNLNYTFTWRDYNKEPLKEGKCYPIFEDVDVIVKRVLEYCEYTTEQVCELLSISAHRIMDPWRKLILEQIGNHQEQLIGNQEICKAIRQTIVDNYRYSNRKDSSKNDASLYNNLLISLTSKDSVMRNVWLFENEWVNVRQNAKFDYDKEVFERKRLREVALNEVIAEKGIEGIIALAGQAGDPLCVGRIYGTIDKEEHYSWFLAQYQDNQTLYKFVSGYIWGTAFDQDKQTISYEKILEMSRMIANPIQQSHVLALHYYSPLVGDYIDTLEQNAQDEYWKNARVGVGFDIERVIDRLNGVGRHATAIEYIMLSLEKGEHTVPDDVMYDTLMLFWKNGMQGARDGIGYSIRKIIKHLDKSTLPKVQDNIIMLELLFFDAHKGHDDEGQKLRMLKDMLSDSNVMIQFIDASSLPDDEEDTKIMLQKMDNDPWTKYLHRTISHIMWDFHGIPCADDNGKVNYTALKSYVEKLLALGVEHHRVNNTQEIIGKLLANIPIYNERADEELCDILECLANDNIDNAYQVQKFNSRGVVEKGQYQGGDSEFALETRYNKIAENAVGYTHLPKIFRALAKEYHSFGKQEDNDAELRQLQY